MAGFGENLRREREMRGISLEEISDTTKISVRFLQCLEADDFSKLPGGIFIRSFIRSYANYLGLDAEQVMAEYQLIAPPKGDENFSRLGVTGTTQNKSRAPILPWITAVILLAGGYAIFRYSHRSTEAPLSFGNPPPASKAASASASATLKAPSGPPPRILTPSASRGSSPIVNGSPSEAKISGNLGTNTGENPGTPADTSRAAAQTGDAKLVPRGSVMPAGAAAANTNRAALAGQTGAPSRPAAANTHAQPAANAKLVLQVLARERTWITVKADGKTVLERVLNPNDLRTLTASQSFDVTTGNAKATVLTLNGVTLEPLGRRGEVKMVHLTQDSLKSQTP